MKKSLFHFGERRSFGRDVTLGGLLLAILVFIIGISHTPLLGFILPIPRFAYRFANAGRDMEAGSRKNISNDSFRIARFLRDAPRSVFESRLVGTRRRFFRPVHVTTKNPPSGGFTTDPTAIDHPR
jgi:hypothetical protein